MVLMNALLGAGYNRRVMAVSITNQWLIFPPTRLPHRSHIELWLDRHLSSAGYLSRFSGDRFLGLLAAA